MEKNTNSSVYHWPDIYNVGEEDKITVFLLNIAFSSHINLLSIEFYSHGLIAHTRNRKNCKIVSVFIYFCVYSVGYPVDKMPIGVNERMSEFTLLNLF